MKPIQESLFSSVHFSKNTIDKIIIYTEAPGKESKNGPLTAKFTPTQIEALKSITREYNISVSEFIRKAIDNYLLIFPFESKIHRNRELLFSILENLK